MTTSLASEHVDQLFEFLADIIVLRRLGYPRRHIVAAAGRAAAQVQSLNVAPSGERSKKAGVSYINIWLSLLRNSGVSYLRRPNHRPNCQNRTPEQYNHVIRRYYLDVDIQFFTAVLASDFDLGNFPYWN